MAKNIEMNNLNEDGTYEVVYPKTRQELVIDLLNDDTKTLLGLGSTATANDAFKELYYTIALNGKSLVTLTFLDSTTSKPIQGVVVSCSAFCDVAGTAISSHTSDENGQIIAFVSATSPTISISGYYDINNFSATLSVDKLGQRYEFSYNLTTVNFKSFTSSSSGIFSGNVQYIDVTLVGGGGGGGHGYSDSESNDNGSSGGGGGGGYALLKSNYTVTPNSSYTVTIGSAGTGAPSNGSATSGGKTSFGDLSVSGGEAGKNGRGRTSAGSGGGGNGNGGAGGYYTPFSGGSEKAPTKGSDGTVYGYTSFTQTALFSGGGSGGNVIYENTVTYGGEPYGGDQGKAATGYGGGGSGGGSGGQGTNKSGYNGYKGFASIRMLLKSQGY